MVCRYCHKKLPETKESKCPNCFAEWAPLDEAMKEENKKTRTGEPKTVNGHD